MKSVRYFIMVRIEEYFLLNNNRSHFHVDIHRLYQTFNSHPTICLSLHPNFTINIFKNMYKHKHENVLFLLKLYIAKHKDFIGITKHLDDDYNCVYFVSIKIRIVLTLNN